MYIYLFKLTYVLLNRDESDRSNNVSGQRFSGSSIKSVGNRWSRGWNWTRRDISNIWSHDGNRSRFRKWNVCLISNARSTPTYNRIRVRVPFPRPFFRDPSIASSSKFARLLVAQKKKKEKKEQKWKRNNQLFSFIIVDQIVYFFE